MARTFYVAGVKFHHLRDVIHDIKPGDELDLVPEPDNQFDPNAVRIEFRGEDTADGPEMTMLGYVPKVFSAEISAILDLDELICLVEKVSPSSAPWEQLKVTIKSVDETTEGGDDEETP